MAFPAVSLVDNFKRAGETGAESVSLGELWRAINGGKTGQIASEQFFQGNGFVEGAPRVGTSIYFNIEPEVQAVECELEKLPEAEKRSAMLWLCLTSPGTTALKGYRVTFEEEGTAGKFKLVIHKIVTTGGAPEYTVIASVEKIAIAAKDLLGFSVEGGKVKAWTKSGAGEMTVRLEVADATYSTGLFGVGLNGTESRMAEVKTGALKVPVVPSLTLEDNLKRTENPLSNGGKWIKFKDTGHEQNLKDTATGVKSTGGFEGGNHGSQMYWNESFTAPFATIAEIETNTNERYFEIWINLAVEGGEAKTGYRVQFEYTATTAQLRVKVFKYTAGVGAELAGTKVEKVPALKGEAIKYAVDQREGRFLVWIKVHAAMPWLPIINVAEETYTSGFCAIGANGETQEFVNFEVGQTKVAKEFKETLTVTQAQSASLTREIKRTLTSSQAQSPNLSRSVSKTLTTTQTQTASVTAFGEQRLSQTQVASLTKEVRRTLSLTQAQSPVVGVEKAASVSTTQAQSAVVTRTVGRALTASQAQAPSVTAETTAAAGTNALAMIL